MLVCRSTFASRECGALGANQRQKGSSYRSRERQAIGCWSIHLTFSTLPPQVEQPLPLVRAAGPQLGSENKGGLLCTLPPKSQWSQSTKPASWIGMRCIAYFCMMWDGW